MPQLYEIPPELYSYDDIRIDKLKAGAISHEEFMRLIRMDDPFMVRDGKLIMITKADEANTIAMFITHMRKFLMDSGGLGGPLIYNNRNIFTEAYPELKPAIDAFIESLKSDPCEGCAINTRTAHLVTQLFTLPMEGRDLSKIEALMVGPYQKFTMMKLKHEKYEILDSDIVIPDGMVRKVLPLKKAGAEASMPEVDAEGLISMDGCRMCVLKHISEAMVLAIEILQGYSADKGHYKHIARLIGNLSAGESECVAFDPELAMRIRILRLKIMGQTGGTHG